MQLLCRFVGNLGRAEQRDASGTLLKTQLLRTSSKKLDFCTFSLLVYGLSFDEQLKTAHFHTDFKTYVDILAVDPHAW